ncbi:hypothetical protein H4R20_004340 [Coemansia guatemalensis]|uniref:HMG box domain-containing protein n=1 Tax=Coemansia guatemalensis TaxID=2761395 RepID=A0A9W8HYU1_9FUNG|nr:hypothetical protein H4R20_004340 [Coemansia guatemalensis]
MDQGHLFVSPSHSSDFQQHQQQQAQPIPAMSHSASNSSDSQSPADSGSPSVAMASSNGAADISLALGNQQQQQQVGAPGSGGHQLHQHHQGHPQQSGYADSSSISQPSQTQYTHLPPASALQQPMYSSAFSSATSPATSQQHGGQPGGGMYQTSPQGHASSSAQYAQDQSAALAPLQLGQLGAIGHQRPASGFPYDFDPNDASCRGVYPADVDPTNPSPQMPQQLTTAGYIRHGGSIPVTPAQPQPALSATAHTQNSIDMAAAAAANISLSVDINGDQNAANQQQPMHATHQHPPFGGSPVSNQPIFTTLSFQNSQLQEYEPYSRNAKRSGRATKPKRTPRPPNAFILYRKAKQAEVIRDNPGVSNKDVSCIIGHMWKGEGPAVQDKYREQAELEKKKHKEMHPNYKYQPRKPKNKRMQEAQAAASASGALVPGSGQEGAFGNGLSVGGAPGALSSVMKDHSASSAGSGFQPYSKYHLMMQPGQGQPPSQQHMHPQATTSQQQAQIPRSEEYYYRSSISLSEQQQQQQQSSQTQQQAQQHPNGGFMSVPPPPQLDIKPGFMNGIPAAAYWTPATPSDAAFSNTLPSGNVFHGSDQAAAAHMRSFDSVVPQHSAATAGPAMGAPSAQMFHQFEHPRQHPQHQQHAQLQQGQQLAHDAQGHLDYQTGQPQQYHQHHGGQMQQPPHSAPALGNYVNGGQAYHHPQQAMDGLDGSSMATPDSQGLGLLSPPAVAWSASNM